MNGFSRQYVANHESFLLSISVRNCLNSNEPGLPSLRLLSGSIAILTTVGNVISNTVSGVALHRVINGIDAPLRFVAVQNVTRVIDHKPLNF